MLSTNDFYELCFQSIKKVLPAFRTLTEEDVNTTFSVLGLDSLDTMNFLLELETIGNISVGQVDLKNYNTFAKLYDYYTGL